MEESGWLEVVRLVNALERIGEVAECEFVDVDAELGRDFEE